MEVLDFVLKNNLQLIPILIFIGYVLKNISLNDKYIPTILTFLGVGFVLLGNGYSAENIYQGILVAACAVYGNQLYKQASKDV